MFAFTVGIVVNVLIHSIAITTNFGAWYSNGSKLALALMVVIVGYGFYISTMRGKHAAIRLNA